ncbi:MAG TPA: alpha/beta hydrolase-fold protein [Polyangiaceae bacterium]|nr:alpha/beta hydrolase-fold protein [Polyangiaceae bacterium]
MIRPSTWSHLRAAIAALLGGASLTLASAARADVALAPSPDGHVGAFLSAGPVPTRQTVDVASLHPSEGARLGNGLGALAWAVADGGTTSFDLGKVFGKTANRGLLACEVVLTQPLTGWLLLSADGSVSASIDGKPVFVREAAHLRGAAWDPIALSLASGAHTVVLDLKRRGRPWNAEVRLLDAANLEPPRGALFRLPGALSPARLAMKLADVRVSSGVVPGGFQPQVRVDFPRGAPLDPAVTLSVIPSSHARAVGGPLSLGALAADPTSVPARAALLPAIASAETSLGGAVDQVEVRIGDAARTFDVHVDPEVSAAVGRALSLRARLLTKPPSASSDVETCAATLEARTAELAALEDRGDPTVVPRAERLDAFVGRVESGGDPLRDHGVLELARRSRLDGAPDPVRVHVPASYDPRSSRKYPLVVLLHGYLSTPERIMNAFLGTDSLAPHPRVDGFVLAPSAHGDAFYRGPGEIEVLDALDWALRTYPIDPERVSIAGHSMGGTGAAQIGFRFPDRFSAIAALSGYHSFFVRRDVQGRPLRPWELVEMTRWSPASFAENGRDELLLVAQGLQDQPLAHSQSLVDRYRALGYPFRETWPDIGHDVWRIVWAGAGMWPALSEKRATPMPAHVTFKTDSLRYAARAWTRITSLSGATGLVDATRAKDHVVVRTRGVDALSLSVRAAGVTGPATVELDGQRFEAEDRDPSAFHRDDGKWTVGPRTASPKEKHAFVEGPIRDAWNGPLAFVYGTLDARQTNAAREVAEHFRARWSGDTRYAVLADRAVPRALGRTHSLFLVGSKDSNLLVRELDAALPFGIEHGAVRAGRALLPGDPESGVVFIYPNPENPERYVAVLSAVSAAGLFRAMSLPLQLPDFMVFDSRLAPAAGQQVLGDARVLGGGYFDRYWALPRSLADVLLPGVSPAAPTATSAAPSERRSPSSDVRAPPASKDGSAPARGPRP